MKHFLSKNLLTAILLLVSVAVTANVPHRLVYGYFRSYNAMPGGWAKFYMDKTSDVDFVKPSDGVHSVFCGACADNVMYYCEYEFKPAEGPVPSGFYSYNITTGKTTLIGQYSDEDSNPSLKYLDMTYDYSTNTMYAVGFEYGTTSLFTFDLSTGKPTKVADLDDAVSTLACNLQGELYGIHQDGMLKKIDKATGKCTNVFDTGYTGMLQNQSIEFDHTTGKLYWASNVLDPWERSGITYLVSIDMSKDDFVMEDVGEFGDDAVLLSLYIPFVKAGVNAPMAPTEVTVVPGEKGAPEAVVSWKNPEMTFGGEQLDNLKSITIKRDDEVVKTISSPQPGMQMSFKDTDIPAGEYRYTVYATNDAGDGEEAYQYAYVGCDSPAAPQNVSVKPGEGCQSGIISWEKPLEGVHGGYFTDENLTYRIVRHPDEVEVAKDLTGTSYTDIEMRRLGAYSYEVFAVNEYGETSATSDKRVLGKAVNVTESEPFVEDFTSQSVFENRWTAVDGNNDLYSWTYNTLAASYQFGGSGIGAEYYINPGMPNDGNPADEWLITPPLNLEAGHKYAITLSTRVMSDEDVSITEGNTNEAEDQAVIKQLTMTEDETGVLPVPFKDYTVELPVKSENRIACVGVHLTTPYPSTGFSFLHIGSITVDDVTNTSGIEDVVQNEANKTTGIYNLNGQYIGKSVDKLKKGVYVVGRKKIVVGK